MIGYVYKIVNEDESVVYIGSTTSKLTRRFGNHKSHYNRWKDDKISKCCMIYHEFDKYGVDTFKIQLVEEVEFEDRCELYRRENHYISTTKCCNKNSAPTGLIPSERKKQYREANKDKINEQRKQYREANKDKINEQRKQYQETNKDKINEQRKQYREANKGKISEQRKLYRESNKEQISERKKEKYDCECGSTLRKSDKAAHERSKKHQNYIIN